MRDPWKTRLWLGMAVTILLAVGCDKESMVTLLST